MHDADLAIHVIFCINIITKLKTSVGNRVVALSSFDLY